ncbi:hypothetical protein B5F73_07225 [Olsenella sp. An270]|nr:hypothetical protein B5F73_07225 [Olsenella sp. An270]
MTEFLWMTLISRLGAGEFPYQRLRRWEGIVTRRLRLVVSCSCALASLALCLVYGAHVRQEAERVRSEALERYGGEVVTLVVATEGIEAGESVSRANAAEREWLVDLAPADAVTSIDSVIGSDVSVPVAAGVPLTGLNFRDAAEAVEVPEGRVALTVTVDDDLGVPPGVSAGELLAAYEVDEDGVQLLAGDVRVLSAPEGGAGMLSAGSITVAVAPDDVARMLAASAAGSLRLALPGERALEVAEGEQSAPASVPAEDDQTEADDEVAPGQGATEGVDES